MIGGFCYGRKCKLGWGYIKDLDLLIPIEGEPLNIISTADDESELNGNFSSSVANKRWSSSDYSLSTTNIPYWVSLLFMYQIFSSFLDLYEFLFGTNLQENP